MTVRKPAIHLLSILLLALITTGCVYELDVQQGNKLEPEDVANVEVGMTRSQVRFLLGTPVVANSFHPDRWDYMYYYRPGRADTAERRWLIVWFDGDLVSEIQIDVHTQPG